MKKYVEITLDDKVYKLRYDFEAMSIIEQELGHKINELDFGSFSFKETVIMVWAGLLWDNKDITKAQVGHMIDGNNINYVSERIAEAFSICFPQAQGQGESKNEQSRIGTGENIERLG